MANESYVVKGHVHHVGDTVQITESFKKREMVVVVGRDTQYPDYIKLEAVQQNVHLLEELQFNDECEVYFNLRGKPFKSKTDNSEQFFNQLQIWRIKSKSQPHGKTPVPEYAPPADIGSAPDEDDLPF